jgi:hypothetical protein
VLASSVVIYRPWCHCIPEISQLAEQQVEVFVVVEPEAQEEVEASETWQSFLNKWRGFLKGHDPEQLKAQYLSEKHQITL